ncbi:MAG: hypothetical protein MJA82_09150 [Clostridia bacterium]|nr:hypothetical protein [Clostridia bacterium]
MDKLILNRYENVLFNKEQLPLFYELLEITKINKKEKEIKILEVFKLIIKNSAPNKRGITKKEIQLQLNISRKICDDIISILQGMTIINHDSITNEQPWTATKRGLQMAKFYKEKIKGGNMQ